MAKLLQSDTGHSTLRVALVPRSAFAEQGVDPSEHPRFCSVDGEGVRVSISPAAYDYLRRLGERERDREIVRALAFGEANAESRRRGGTHRLWSTDLALLHGARTPAEVMTWHARHGVVNRASDVGTLYLPDAAPKPDADDDPELRGDWWLLERNGVTFFLPRGRYRTGRAGMELFQQLLKELDEETVRDLVTEALEWAPEARRRFRDRPDSTRRADEESVTVEALFRALGLPWEEAGRLGASYRYPSRRADLSPYLGPFATKDVG